MNLSILHRSYSNRRQYKSFYRKIREKLPSEEKLKLNLIFHKLIFDNFLEYHHQLV